MKVKAFGIAFLVLLGVILGLIFITPKEMARLQNISGDTFILPPSIPSAVKQAVSYADSMIGKPYDPLMGRYGDPFGKIGFVVCIDVPIRAYQSTGVSLPSLLREAAREHKEWFSIGPNNPPSSPFFYRRVRNYLPLFQNHPKLSADLTPHVGDLAFYGKTHIALVVRVEPGGDYMVIEASPVKGRVSESDSYYMTKTWGAPVLFGRLKPEPEKQQVGTRK